jgi:HIV Tat-specific factor 1
MSATAPTALPRAAPGAPAEDQAAAFEDDPRVYFDTQAGRWRLEDGDTELEYESSKAVWIPVVSLPHPPPTPQGLRNGSVSLCTLL